MGRRQAGSAGGTVRRATSGPATTAPSGGGNLVLGYQMVKDYQFWFTQFADVNVLVISADPQADYDPPNNSQKQKDRHPTGAGS